MTFLDKFFDKYVKFFGVNIWIRFFKKQADIVSADLLCV